MTDNDIHLLLAEYKITRKQEIRDTIVVQYTNLVESIARRFSGSAEPTEDLVQEGYIGLITAVDGFNPSKGVKFSTYATHFVIGQIKHYLRDKGKIIKEPAWLQELNQKVVKVVESLAQELGRPPTHAEIGKLMEMSEESVSDLITTREVFKVASLDGGNDQDDETSSSSYDMDRVKTDKAVDVELPVEERVVLNAALGKLKDLEQAVVQEFYFRGHNQTEIARELGISCNYVSHILRNSTKKLKKIMVTDELIESQRELTLMKQRLSDATRLLEEQTVVDCLTRLYNRRYCESRLDEELSRGSRHGYQVAFVMVELEGHDEVSRALGTIKSEEILRHASKLIISAVRRVDIVTRFGPQTFALVLPHTGPQVSIVANRITEALACWIESDELDRGRAPIGLRIGAAHWPAEASDAQDLIQKASCAMNPPSVERELVLAA